MTSDIYAAARRQAQADLVQVTNDYEAKKNEKEALEELIACLRRLEPTQPQLPMELPPRENYVVPADPKLSRKSPNGTRKLAIDAIALAGRPLAVPDIHRYIVSVLGGMAPKRESIRVLMIRTPAIFEQCGDGMYGLREGHENAPQEEELEEEVA